MEERRETGEVSRGTNRSEISGHVPAENRTGTILQCNRNTLETQTGFFSFPSCCEAWETLFPNSVTVPLNAEIFEGLLPETISRILNHATGTTEN